MAYIINTFSPGTEVKVINKTAAQWTAQNPRLSAFELGVETDTGKAKLGDGTTLWASLSYWAPNSGDVAGPSSATDFRAMGTIADTASVRPLAMTSALATDLVDTATTGDAIATIDFTITCNAAGTFIPRFAKEADAAGATNTVYRGSYMLITDVA